MAGLVIASLPLETHWKGLVMTYENTPAILQERNAQMDARSHKILLRALLVVGSVLALNFISACTVTRQYAGDRKRSEKQQAGGGRRTTDDGRAMARSGRCGKVRRAGSTTDGKDVRRDPTLRTSHAPAAPILTDPLVVSTPPASGAGQ